MSNRLTPLIKRRRRPIPALAGISGSRWEATEEASGGMADDLRLFATAWIGGLVFFGTYLS